MKKKLNYIILLVTFCGSAISQQIVHVSSTQEGQGILRQYKGGCYLIVPKHVIGEDIEFTILDSSRKQTKAIVEATYPVDISIAKIQDSSICDSQWLSSNWLNNELKKIDNAMITSLREDGSLKRRAVMISEYDNMWIQIRVLYKDEELFQGLSGSMLTRDGKLIGQLMSINPINKKGLVLRQDFIDGLLKTRFGDVQQVTEPSIKKNEFNIKSLPEALLSNNYTLVEAISKQGLSEKELSNILNQSSGLTDNVNIIESLVSNPENNIFVKKLVLLWRSQGINISELSLINSKIGKVRSNIFWMAFDNRNYTLANILLKSKISPLFFENKRTKRFVMSQEYSPRAHEMFPRGLDPIGYISRASTTDGFNKIELISAMLEMPEVPIPYWLEYGYVGGYVSRSLEMSLTPKSKEVRIKYTQSCNIKMIGCRLALRLQNISTAKSALTREITGIKQSYLSKSLENSTKVYFIGAVFNKSKRHLVAYSIDKESNVIKEYKWTSDNTNDELFIDGLEISLPNI